MKYWAFVFVMMASLVSACEPGVKVGERLVPQPSTRQKLIAAANLKEPRPEALEAAVKDFFAFLRRGAVVQAYHAYGSDQFRAATSEQQFREVIKRYEVLARNKELYIFDLQFNELYTRYYGTMKILAVGQGGARNLIEVDAIHEHGKWRILGLQVFKVPDRLLQFEEIPN